MQLVLVSLVYDDAQLGSQCDEICAKERAGRPICSGLVERRGECVWFHARKTAMAVVQQDSYGLPEPGGREDQVNRVVSVDVACFDSEAAGGRDKLHGLPAGSGELKLNPVSAGAGLVATRLHAGQVEAAVAVEIGNCKRQAWTGRYYRSVLSCSSSCTDGAGGNEKQRQEPQEETER